MFDEPVEFTCPECGETFIVRQSQNDEWYKLGTKTTLCPNCAKEILNKWRNGMAEKTVIPHRNYKYLSDYWCECGWHLGKKGSVKYCADCGRKIDWNAYR